MMKTLTINHSKDMQRYIAQVWLILVDSYAQVNGGLHYDSPEELIDDTQRWRLVVRHGQVIAVTLFKAKRGWKLVAMATCRNQKERARIALKRLIQADLSRCWMELSERAEAFVLKHCGGHHFVVHASLAADLLGKPVKMQVAGGFHYQREVCGFLKSKVIVGTPDFL